MDILEQDSHWREHVVSRCNELESKVMGSVEPSLDEALVYFKFSDIKFRVFGIGRDLSDHPRNPFRKKTEKNLDNQTNNSHTHTMTEKDQAIVSFLQKAIQELHPRVFGKDEPLMTERMTFFAYNQFLWVKHKIGNDLSKHPRNPWHDCVTPLNFDDYQQIRPLPVELAPAKVELAKTQVIPTLVTPVQELLCRVYDVDKPARTVFQGTEAECFRYVAKANKDTGYKAFDYQKTDVKFTPRSKDDGQKLSSLVHKPHVGSVRQQASSCACNLPPVRIKNAKSKVQEYLERCKQTSETPTETK